MRKPIQNKEGRKGFDVILPLAPEVFGPLPPDVVAVVFDGVCFSEDLSVSG
jgi:hypothetical protein